MNWAQPFRVIRARTSRASPTSWLAPASLAVCRPSRIRCANWNNGAAKATSPRPALYWRKSVTNFQMSGVRSTNFSKASQPRLHDLMKRTYTPTKPKKILIVDDDRLVVSAYQSKLESDRYTVEVAVNGEEALRMLKALSVDLVILDFSIPGMNGVDVLNAIRSQPGTEALPVIVFTNAHLPALAQIASKAGATRCVRKSDCTPNQILVIVREVFAAGAIPAQVP